MRGKGIAIDCGRPVGQHLVGGSHPERTAFSIDASRPVSVESPASEKPPIGVALRCVDAIVRYPDTVQESARNSVRSHPCRQVRVAAGSARGPQHP
jgi:hypothetical protein